MPRENARRARPEVLQVKKPGRTRRYSHRFTLRVAVGRRNYRPLEVPPQQPPRARRRACERRAAAAGWQVPAEPTMPRLNSPVLGF